jgi:hypothetical protein
MTIFLVPPFPEGREPITEAMLLQCYVGLGAFDEVTARANCLRLWVDSCLLLRSFVSSDTTQTRLRRYKKRSRR